MKCPVCARTVGTDARFCKYCGAALHKGDCAVPPPIKTAPANIPTARRADTPATPPPLRKKGCGFGSVLLALVLLLGGGAAWFFTQQFRLERAAYERIRRSNSVAEIEDFLKLRMYMPEEHRRVAEARIARLQSDSVDFAHATTVEACQRYLSLHADGRYVEEVQNRLNRLRRTRQQPVFTDTVQVAQNRAPESTDMQGDGTETSRATSESVEQTAAPPARYHVVAASFGNYDTATMRAAGLRAKGYSAYVMEGLSDEGRIYRVVLASYSDVEAARRTAQAVRRECPDVWVLSK